MYREGDVVDLGSGITWRLSAKLARHLNKIATQKPPRVSIFRRAALLPKGSEGIPEPDEQQPVPVCAARSEPSAS